MKIKTCKSCKETKAETDFYRSGKYFQSYCKICDVAKSLERRENDIAAFKKKRHEDWKQLTAEQKEKHNSAKKKAEVTCIDCEKIWMKRKDSISLWSGRCKSCNAKHLSTLPQTKIAKRKNGLAFIAEYGKIPSPKIENRGRGETHYNWRGGITPFRIRIWQSAEYKAWRLAVFERDAFKCVACGINTHALEADHIKPFALFPELRFAVDNGRTLCIPMPQEVRS